MTAQGQIREARVAFLRRELVGPSGMESEILQESPCQRYLAGVLFPHRQLPNPLDDLSSEEDQPRAGEKADSVTDALLVDRGPEVAPPDRPAAGSDSLWLEHLPS